MKFLIALSYWIELSTNLGSTNDLELKVLRFYFPNYNAPIAMVQTLPLIKRKATQKDSKNLE